MLDEPLSQCCHATMTVEGRTTHYYVCNKCGKPCDQEAIKELFND